MKEKNEIMITDESLFEYKENYLNFHKYNALKKNIKNSIRDIFNKYLSIGAYLREIKNKKLYLLQDYKNIYEFAAEEFELSETTTKSLININLRFCNGSNDNEYDDSLLDDFKNFSYSQLVELLSIPGDESLVYLPSMTVKEIRDNKKAETMTKDIKKMINFFVNTFFELDPIYLKNFKYSIQEYYSSPACEDLNKYDFVKNDSFYILFFLNKNYIIKFRLASWNKNEALLSCDDCYVEGYYVNLQMKNIKTVDDFKKVCNMFIKKLKAICPDEVFTVPKAKGKTKAEKQAEQQKKEKEFEKKVITDNERFNISSSAVQYTCESDLVKFNKDLQDFYNGYDAEDLLIDNKDIRLFCDGENYYIKNVKNNYYVITFSNKNSDFYLVDKNGNKGLLSAAFLLSYLFMIDKNPLSEFGNYPFDRFLEKYNKLKEQINE